jgi:hypothetical protein
MNAFDLAPSGCRCLGESTTYPAGPSRYVMWALSGLAGTSIRPPLALPAGPGTPSWGSLMFRFEVEKITA